MVVMSATIDGARFARLMGDAPVIESEGRAHPLRIEWLGSRAELRTDEAMASAVLTAWREEEGDVLAFLPGVGEIERTARAAGRALPDVPILPLHGQVEPAAQRAAIRRDPEAAADRAGDRDRRDLDHARRRLGGGRRRARAPRRVRCRRRSHPPRHRARQPGGGRPARRSRRAAGAGRRLPAVGGGRAPGRETFDPPEMLPPISRRCCWRWRNGAWPTRHSLLARSAARRRAVGRARAAGEARCARRGRADHGARPAIAALPMEPWQARYGAVRRRAWRGRRGGEARAAAAERGLGGRGEDLAQRLARWNGDRASRAETARKLAQGWAQDGRRRSGEPDERSACVPPLGILLVMALPGQPRAPPRRLQAKAGSPPGGAATRSMPPRRSPLPNGLPSAMRRAAPAARITRRCR